MTSLSLFFVLVFVYGPFFQVGAAEQYIYNATYEKHHGRYVEYNAPFALLFIGRKQAHEIRRHNAGYGAHRVGQTKKHARIGAA